MLGIAGGRNSWMKDMESIENTNVKWDKIKKKVNGKCNNDLFSAPDAKKS